ncbi:TraR/DksA C4-type zinc finger protein [Mesorhizobium sp. ES1-1]|uniref:TraR/DksA C4-type zinc finger protein n=1 Tax=Mesorhizobium sp. ES1-1 TaxID=2876629 RepID=UPI001CCC2D0C|nr:TraR/DksA C4-type zinc finger protein [Mesorhizobium sp. ES1-1]MBZ9678913.1 TraR/DksA C4-type zinc finger protein [Mesorhizobium sp. ES1-1]
MSVSNLAFELADRRAEEERAEGIRRVQQALRVKRLTLSPFCDCGELIPDERRKAMPNCKRCIDCETFIERQSRRAS